MGERIEESMIGVEYERGNETLRNEIKQCRKKVLKWLRRVHALGLG